MKQKISIKKAKFSDAEAISKMHIDAWHTTYQGIVDDAYLQSLSFPKRVLKWKEDIKAKRAIIFVAWNSRGKIVGFISGGKIREKIKNYQAELWAVYVSKSFQGQGIGKALVKKLVGALSKQGFRSMVVEVLKDNPSKDFYVALGGKKIKSMKCLIAGKKYDAVVYGWKTLDGILEQS